MLPLERQKWIENKVLTIGKVDIEELSETLQVSAMTIRRDLSELEKEGKAIRTHGGAISPSFLIQETPYSSKESQNISEKKAIARKAVTLIPEHSTIILDSGTTTLEVAKLLVDRDDITIITNDIKIAVELLESKVKVIVTGGELQRGVGGLYGPLTQGVLKNIHVDIFFLGAHAISLKEGITSPTFEKSLIKKLMIEAAESTWLLADSQKFKKKAFSLVCEISSLEGIITDSGLEIEKRRKYEEQVPLLIAGGEEDEGRSNSR
ncbi:MAG: DeoR/GlpR family DNA-binding transcription regulator [Bacillota bacterium]|nr:DeoR/GlpR family DNA-binding transcription regulator [Bacillota bacterium]